MTIGGKPVLVLGTAYGYRGIVEGGSIGEYPTLAGVWIAIYRWLSLEPPGFVYALGRA